VNEIINKPRIKQQTAAVLSGKYRIKRINIKEKMNLEIKFVNEESHTSHGKFVLPPFILPPGWWRRSFPSYVSSRGPAEYFCEVA